MTYVFIWMLAIGGPLIWFVPDFFLERIEGPLFWILDILSVIVFVFIIWSIVSKLPGVTRNGYYYKSDGKTVLEYDKKTVVLDDVTEVMLTDRHASSKGINISITNHGKKIEFLSEMIRRGTDIEDTSFYNIYSQVLAENPHLEQEKDIWGDPIDYWYKAKKS